MKRLKNKNGITLIALVVTIIVLLILAGVAISMLSGDNGILNQAAEAKTRTEEAKEDEAYRLATMEAATNLKGTTHTEKVTESGVEKTLTAPIPAGFAESPREGEQSVKSGLVIMDSAGNEFVWVPLKDKDINTMIMCQSHGSNGECDIEINEETGKLHCTNTKHTNREKICGKLYAATTGNGFNSTLTGQTYNANSGLREPAVVTGDSNGTGSSYDGGSDPATIDSNWTTSALMLAGLQADFEEMALSVYKNKGFYVGRYETSLTSDKKGVQSKAGILSASAETTSANKWYGLYKLQKTFSNTNIGSNMIWGCQYDQMMLWMQDNGINVKSTNYGDKELQYAQKHPATSSDYQTKCITGIEGDKDILNNVYDLLRCRYEWTAEANDTRTRVFRGGNYFSSYSPSLRSISTPAVAHAYYGSRLSLYVK